MIHPFSYSFTQLVNSDRLRVEIANCEEISRAISDISMNGKPVITTITFREALPNEQIAVLNNLMARHDNSPTKEVIPPTVLDAPTTSDKKIKVAAYEPEGSSATIATHNFADKCSWYQGSVAATNTLISQDGTNTIFKGPHTHWIDLTNGRLYDEDNVMLESGNKWAIKIYVNNILQTSGYSVDPVTGIVTFVTPQTETVKAIYHYAVKSYFAMRPKPGKKLSIKTAEIQFSKSSMMTSPFVFEVWVCAPVPFAVPGSQIVYKNAKDLISACNGGQGFIPQWGELPDDVIVFPFDYARPKPILYSQGVEIRVYCRDHKEINGGYTTATFYVAIDNEE